MHNQLHLILPPEPQQDLGVIAMDGEVVEEEPQELIPPIVGDDEGGNGSGLDFDNNV